MYDLYELQDNNVNYYHYQPGPNIIIVLQIHTHEHRRSGCRCLMGCHAVNGPFRGWSLVHSNKHSRGRHGFREFFAYKKIARLN